MCSERDIENDPIVSAFSPHMLFALFPHRRYRCSLIGQHIEWRDCVTCNGKTRLKVYACAVRGKCILADCATCKDYKPAPPASPGASRKGETL